MCLAKCYYHFINVYPNVSKCLLFGIPPHRSNNLQELRVLMCFAGLGSQVTRHTCPMAASSSSALRMQSCLSCFLTFAVQKLGTTASLQMRLSVAMRNLSDFGVLFFNIVYCLSEVVFAILNVCFVCLFYLCFFVDGALVAQ